MNPDLARKLQQLPRMYIYGILATIVVVGLLVTIPLPVIPSTETMRVYDAVENAPRDRVVLMNTNWSAATQGENRPQNRVIFQHLMSRHLRIVFFSFDPQ